jgi:hypothetical protein
LSEQRDNRRAPLQWRKHCDNHQWKPDVQRQVHQLSGEFEHCSNPQNRNAANNYAIAVTRIEMNTILSLPYRSRNQNPTMSLDAD